MTTTTPARLVACAALLTSVLAIVACGDDNDSDSQAQDNPQTATTTPAAQTPRGTDEQQIKQLFGNLQTAFVRKDGQAYCQDLSQPGQQEVVRFGRDVQLKGNCETVITQLAKNSAEAGLKQRIAKVVATTIDGNNAKATIKDADRPPAQLRFVKTDGRWKLYSPGFDDALNPQGGRAAR